MLVTEKVFGFLIAARQTAAWHISPGLCGRIRACGSCGSMWQISCLSCGESWWHCSAACRRRTGRAGRAVLAGRFTMLQLICSALTSVMSRRGVTAGGLALGRARTRPCGWDEFNQLWVDAARRISPDVL